MTLLKKLLRAGTDPVFLGKVFAAATQLLVVVLAARVLAADDANLLFSLLALATILTAMASFGANGALVPFLYRNPDRVLAIVSVLLGAKAVVVLLGALALHVFGLTKGLPALLIAWTAFCGSLSFVDFVAESRGNRDVERISRIKFFVFGVGLVAKIAFFFLSFSALLHTLYVEWLVVWLIYVRLIRTASPDQKRPQRGDLRRIAGFLASSSWVWLSSIVSFGWTRAYFLILTGDLGPVAANAYFVALRVIEGFMLIPNTLAMRFFPDMVSSHHDGDLTRLTRQRTLFLRNILRAAAVIAVAVPLVLLAVYGQQSDEATAHILTPLAAVLLGVATFVLICRVPLSREIILAHLLPLSIVSYLSGAVVSFAVYQLAGADSYGDALLGYAGFALASFASPFLFAPEKLRPFRNGFWAALTKGDPS